MKKNGVLLVEGKDDKAVLYSLCKINGITETFEIRDVIGHGQIFETLESVLKWRKLKDYEFDIRHIGVVVDSNGNMTKRLKDFNEAIKKNGYTEAKCSSDGIVINDNSKDICTVGLWVMPDNSSPGMLEHFFRQFIPSEDTLLPHVESFIDDLPSHDFKAPSPHEKAVVRTWLACQEKSESRMGYFLSGNKERLNVHNDLAESFIAWIRRLFIEPNGGLS